MNDKILGLFEALIDKMLGWFWGPFRGNLDSLNTLIYENKDKYYGIFDEKQFGVVAQGMAVMQSLSVGIILISIYIAAMRISSSGINPSNRTSILEYIKDFIIVALFFFNLSTIFELIFTVNSMFVNGFSSAKVIIGEDMFDKMDNFADKGVLGNLVIGLCLLGLWIWANFYYMMRTITIMLLTIISPLAVALYLIPQTKGITIGVFKEYTGTVFVQAIHAFLYWVITSVASDDFGIGSVLLYMIFIPVSETIRSLLGLGGQMNDTLTKSAAMFGGSALMGVAASVKGALNGQSVAQALRSGAGQAVGKGKGQIGEDGESSKEFLAGVGTDIGSTSRAERMLKAGEIFSKGGKAVFGAAGAIAGSPMGPMGSVAMSSIGFSGGGAIAGVAGRAGMAGAELLGTRLKAGAIAGANKFKGINNAEALADEKVANTIADSETTSWAETNKDSFMKELKERFPDADNNSLNQIWDKEVARKKGTFLKNARSSIGEMKSTSGQHAKGSELVDSTVNNLTNDWAKNNEESFKKDYDNANPLPSNATAGDIQSHNQSKNSAWQQAVAEKKNVISNITSQAASKLGFGPSPEQSFINKEDFASEVGSQIGAVMGTGAGLLAVKGAISSVKSTNGKHAKGTELVDSTVNNLTNDWAKNNEESFKQNYDNANPLQTNSTPEDTQRHNQSKNSAWQQAVAGKKTAIKNIASQAASKLDSFTSPEQTFINKEDFIKEVGNQVGSVMGIGAREGLLAVKGATSSVKNASLYSGKSVNTPYLANQLAGIKTNQAKGSYINDAVANKGMTNVEAEQNWKTVEAPTIFKKQLDSFNRAPSDGGIPRQIPLDHRIIGGNGVVKGLAAFGAGATEFAVEGSGIRQVSKFMGDTKAGTFFKSIPVEYKKAWENQTPFQNPVTASVGSVGSSLKGAWNHGTGHVAENVVEKQAGFRNAVAFGAGIVGGVRGYKAGATYAAGGTKVTKSFGLKGWNPYNNAVNNEISEISQIEQMAQTVTGPNGQLIASGAVRMVTNAGQTVLQVRDKTGQVQTVSRLGSGDSSLKKGETLFQDLTIQNGQFAPTSNVYQEDSGGGRLTSNRVINANPNKLVANRTNPKNPRVVQDVQSYNQLVDSGQYYLKQAMSEMSDIRMVVDRNRSYLVGKKAGNDYRISPYGAGDLRLPVDEVIDRPCETRNNQLVVNPTDTYTSSLQPKDLVPNFQPNKRNVQRQQNDKFRNKSFTEPLR